MRLVDGRGHVHRHAGLMGNEMARALQSLPRYLPHARWLEGAGGEATGVSGGDRPRLRVLQPADAFDVLVPLKCGGAAGGSEAEDHDDCVIIIELEAEQHHGRVPRDVCMRALLNGQACAPVNP